VIHLEEDIGQVFGLHRGLENQGLGVGKARRMRTHKTHLKNSDALRATSLALALEAW